MRILFLNADPLVENGNQLINGGWTYTMVQALSNSDNIDVGVVFPSKDGKNIINSDIHYFPITSRQKGDIKMKFMSLIPFQRKKILKQKDEEHTKKVLEKVNQFKPDIIHIWGSECNNGLISTVTNIPCVLHIQGYYNPIMDNNLPFGVSHISMIKAFRLNMIKTIKYYRSICWSKYVAEREKIICSNVTYVMGRTNWDENISKVLCPQARYFYCSEMLRPLFTNSVKWKYKNSNRLIIQSSIGTPLYKGHDVILRTAKIIKNIWGDNFEWNLYGVNNINIAERLTNIRAKDVNIICKGRVSGEDICKGLLMCDVYCHLSHIENSPNAVCEAQYLGVPVVATDTGGTSTLLKNDSGILIPINDAYQAAQLIKEIKINKALAESLNQHEIQESYKRHSPNDIIKGLISAYKEILR